MNSEKEQHLIQLNRVRAYYGKAQKFYERAWYHGDRGLGLHYGFWTEGVTNRIQAIIKENEILANLADVKSGDLVLDAGCGVGGSGIWLARNRGAKVVELNIARNQLKRGIKIAVKNEVGDSLYFTEGDYQKLPFPDMSFDVLWSLESIEHSDDVVRFLLEAERIMKPGGRIVIAGTFQGENKPTLEQEEQMKIGFRAAGAFNNFLKAVEVVRLLDSMGFDNIQNIKATDLVMESAKEMREMCELGLPLARLGHKMKGLVSQIMVDNTAWGTYQEELFKSGVTSYHLLSAEKP